MDKKAHDKITAFDTLFTTNHIQMLKIVMPCFDHPMQKTLAIYIKYLEFQYTMSFFSSHPVELCGCSLEKEEINITAICTELLPYCTSEEKKKVEHIAGLFRSMEMYQEMSRTFEMMKDIFPEGFENGFDLSGSGAKKTEDQGEAGADSKAGPGMIDMLMNMLSPEQKAMFEMFGGNSGNESE